jgi:methyl-accepting chemotaxis protein
MLKNIKISKKLALMVAIPIIGLIYFTTALTLEKREIVNQMNLLQALSVLTVKSSSLIHELQKERGLSAGFLGSQGAEFSKELLAQRVKTDTAIKELDSFVKKFNFKPFGNEIKDTLEIIFAVLNAIETRRNLVSQLNISAEEQIRYYTAIIDSLLIGINHLSKIISNAELSNQVVAYVNLLQAKEKAGIERATLSNAFSQGYFAPGMYNEFILLIRAQDIYVKNFFFFATLNQKRSYRRIMQGQFVEVVKKIRKFLFNKHFKLKLTADLQSHLGYGGLIHQFKNYVLRGEQKYIEAFYQQYQRAYGILARYQKLAEVSQSELKNIEIVSNTFENYKRHLAMAITLKKQQKPVDEIDAIVKIDDAPAINALNNLLSSGHLEVEPTYWWKMATGRINLFKRVEDQISADLKASAETLKKNAQSVFILSLIITSGTILLTLFLSYVLACGITKPLKSLVNVAKKISANDRNIEIKVNSKDEIGELSSAMAQMLDAIAIQKLEIRERKLAEVKLEETSQAYARFVPNECLQLLDKAHILDVQLSNHVEMNMTILFSDIRSFTTLSEKMSPQENFNFINAYLNEMGPIISTHQGIVDKYIGDAIMALFINADDALNAAIAMLHKVEQFNKTQPSFPSIQIGIGLNTGKLMLGIIGEQNRLQCTVISDAVNLASRIEGITKTYKGSVIISQNTLDRLENPSQYVIRFLDNIKVKGRSERVNIFEVFETDQ